MRAQAVAVANGRDNAGHVWSHIALTPITGFLRALFARAIVQGP